MLSIYPQVYQRAGREGTVSQTSKDLLYLISACSLSLSLSLKEFQQSAEGLDQERIHINECEIH